jgi:hypothetical protein
MSGRQVGTRGLRAVAFGLALAFAGGHAQADDNWYLKQLQTDDLRLVYVDPTQTYLTPYVARAYENSIAFERKLMNWSPWDKPTIVLEDISDSGNAAMHSTPFNGVAVQIAPMSTTFETFTPGERFFTLMNHEIFHVVSLDVANEQDLMWRKVFHGKPLPITDHPETILYNYLAQPRADVPRWYLEGSAVFMETWMGGGLGRAQGGYDEMVWRAKVRDNARFYDPLGLVAEGNDVDFQTGANSYLYGTRFDSYLALTYGPEKVIEWVNRGPDSKAYYADQFEHVFGKPLDTVWAEWIVFEHDWQKKNLQAVEKYPTTQMTPLANRALGSVSRAFYDPKSNSFIAGFRDAGQLANIAVVSLADGSTRKLANLKGPAYYRPTSLTYDPDAGKIYYTADNTAFRDLMETDLNTGETHELLSHARIGDIAFDRADKSIWGIRHLNGLDTLVRIRAAHDAWNQVITFNYGTQWTDLDISADGTLLCATISEVDGTSRLDVFRIGDLLQGKTNPVASLKLGQSMPEDGVFSPDGRYIYATAYYTGVSNVYRLDLKTNKFDAMTNAVTGFFRPLPLEDGSMIVFEYTGNGFLPVKIHPKPLDDLGNIRFLGTEVADTHPIVKTWAVGSPANVPIDSMITSRGDYHAENELRWDGSYPFVAGYKGHAALGWQIVFDDPLLYDEFSANVAISPAGDLDHGQELHADVKFNTLYWNLELWHNKADFYDLFGPTERSRAGDALLIGYRDLPLFDPPRQLKVTADLDLYSGLDTLPGAQNVGASNDHDIATGKVGLDYTDVDKSLGAIDNEEGLHAYGLLQIDYAHEEAFPKLYAGLDVGTALSWNHASIWLYTAAGATEGDRNNALDYFYFGAFGNNYVDDRDVKRYRDYDSFPGFGIDALDSRDFLKATGEFNFPPLRFADVGTPSLYLNGIRSAIFAGVLDTDQDGHDGRTVEDLGFQIDFEFSVAVHLPMTFSIGSALGFENGTPRSGEVMASLKIL